MNHWKTVIDNHATYLMNKFEPNIFLTLASDISYGICRKKIAGLLNLFHLKCSINIIIAF